MTVAAYASRDLTESEQLLPSPSRHRGAVLDPGAGLLEGGGGGEDGLFVVFATHDLEADGEAVG